MQHFTSTNDGRVMTVDSNSGFVLWQRDFGNVIVNMYLLKGDGMHRLPSTAIGRETFDLLAQVGNKIIKFTNLLKIKKMKIMLFSPIIKI